MRYIVIVLRASCLLMLVSYCQFAVRQGKAAEQGDRVAAVRLALGSTSGEPGESVVVPVYFTPAKGIHVGEIYIEVTFVSANLKFDKVEAGIASETGNVDLSKELKISRNDQGVETSTLSLQAKSSSKAIPSGLLAYIQFKINASGRPAKISLKTKADVRAMGSGEQIADVQAANATVEVIAPGSEPAVVCFFFTH